MTENLVKIYMCNLAQGMRKLADAFVSLRTADHYFPRSALFIAASISEAPLTSDAVQLIILK
jgi:hypothetical protein